MPHGPRPCSVCAVPLQAAWPFREDDRYCALCGERILRLLVQPLAPDGTVWIYHDPQRGFLVHLAWERGIERQPDRRRQLRPLLDLPRCAAHFQCERLGDLDFGFQDISSEGDGAATIRLLPRFPGFDIDDLPPGGIRGQLVLATSAGTEILSARLLPQARDAALECPDPSVRRDGDLWQVYRQDGGTVVPLRLVAPVAQWVQSLKGNVEPGTLPGLALEGINGETLLEPGRPLELRLRVEEVGWELLRPVPFTFLLRRAALDPLPLRGQIVLLPSSQLLFEGGSSRSIAVRLGCKAVVSIPLTARDSGVPAPAPLAPPQPDADGVLLEFDAIVDTVHPEPPSWDVQGMGVRILECAVEQGAHERPWLRVLTPRREGLPWELPPGSLARLDLEVDATGLDREKHDGTTLRGAVALVDSRQRRWRFEIQVAVSRPLALPAWVAFDWGTTNSCAAYRLSVRPGDDPVSLSFDEEQRKAPELFPSDLYFVDLSDPQNPVFLLGHEASRRGRERPECCLRSVKRAFQFRDRLFVMDERQRGHTYTTEELACLLLRRLVALAEEALEQEIHRLGLTFPTKWPARVRHKLERVAVALEEELRVARRPFAVTVLPPAIDEANAVALDLITSEHGHEDLPETFYLIAYDFGGGTVDTSLLEVHLPEDLAAVRTRYLGLGGRGDFGGDDLTRAVMTCLRDRILEAPQCRRVLLDGASGQTVRLLGIPLVATGEPLRATGPEAAQWHHLGRQNWDTLWTIAELLKIRLCDTAVALPTPPLPTPPTTQLAPEDADFGESLAMDVEEEERRHQAVEGRHPVRDFLQPRLDKIVCRVLVESGREGVGEEAVWPLDALLDRLDADTRDDFFRDLDFTLEEACTYPLEDIFETNGGRPYTVRERVEETVLELRAQCDAHGVRPDVIVLAGGGCRLPLVSWLFREHFPSDHELLHYSRDHAKRRVAYGMASYLALREVVDLDRQLARSVDVIHQALGVRRTVVERRRARVEFQTVVPVGAPLQDPGSVHAFRFLAGQLLPGNGTGRRLPLWVRDWRRGEQEYGHFELAGLPVMAGATYEAELRLRGQRQMELIVSQAGISYGPFPLIPRIGEMEGIQ